MILLISNGWIVDFSLVYESGGWGVNARVKWMFEDGDGGV